MENQLNFVPLIEANQEERIAFYRKTYLHVAGALLAFILVEALLLMFVPTDLILSMVSTKMTWLFLIGLFWLVSMVVNKFAFSESKSMQYVGLGIYVLIEAIIFLPMLYIATALTESSSLVAQAALITLALFTGLTAIALFSKTDFSFLKSFLIIGGLVSLALIVAGAIFGFNLGLWFSVAMVLLASASILYQTSKLNETYHTGQYVGAALQIFASVLLLFWYILRILLSSRR